MNSDKEIIMARTPSGMHRKNMYIAPEIWERLEKLAKRDGLTVSDLIRRAVVEFLKKEENL